MRWITYGDGWRPWFAWYPVYISQGNGKRLWVWWEKVNRKPNWAGWTYSEIRENFNGRTED